MKIRPGPNHAKRRRNKSRTSRRQARDVWNRNMQFFITKLAYKCTKGQQPTELTIVLRLINILGLALIVMLAAFLGNDGNLKEIVNFGKELFRLLP